VVVVGHQAEQVASVVEPLEAVTVLQQPQNGTGHAMQVAKRALGRAKFCRCTPRDAPLVRSETLKALITAHRNGNAAATILSAVLADPSGYGRVVRKTETTVSAIVEESQLTGEQREINEINSAIYCFTLEKLWPALAQVKPNNKHRELYLTDAIAVLNAKGETVLVQVAVDSREVLGCNTRADLAEVDRMFRERKRNWLMDEGVTIQLPETVLIDPEVTAGEDTVIEPGVQLLGKTKIGARCTIRTGSVLTDAILGDDVTVEPHCVVVQSRLDDRVIIGPFARLRPDNHLKAGARIGNFVELKKSTIGEGTKAMHLSYLGDAKIGAKSNIGAGTITCNYDGFHKYPTSIGNKVFIGSDTALVAPVARRRRRLRCRRFDHHGKRAIGWVGNCPWPPGQQTGLGREETPRIGRRGKTKEKFFKKKTAQNFEKTQTLATPNFRVLSAIDAGFRNSHISFNYNLNH